MESGEGYWIVVVGVLLKHKYLHPGKPLLPQLKKKKCNPTYQSSLKRKKVTSIVMQLLLKKLSI